ncbi:phosphatase PAP2 family protein [Psychrobacter sanguinis]|uniref:undecaprenyl-diphosphate phosphatase n=1 Tax=Psychrobacter sanguinis TaxID=861445 RepID=A0A844LZ35_9GAMM|nr:phosphatase PAP2 family protein [Psychrobacter sanguinis]
MKSNQAKPSLVRQLPPNVAPSPVFTLCSRSPALAVYVNQLISWDTTVCIHINRYSTNYAVAIVFKSISRLGDGWFWYAMMLAALVVYGQQAFLPIITTLLISLIGLAIYKVLKIKTVRPRPYQVHQVIVLGERPLDVFSFPSGHTLQAVLFSATLGSYFPQLLPVMMLFALLVALSRMVLGLHYPTDVLIGGAIGYSLSLWAPDMQKMVEHSLLLL